MVFFTDQLLNALILGGIYALIAVGYTMVYGIIKLVNFAHGEVYMCGAFFCIVLLANTPLPFWACLIFSMAGCAALGYLMDRFAYRSVRESPRLAALITAVGLSLFLQNLAMLIWGSEPRPFPSHPFQAVLSLAGGRLKVPWKFLFIWAASLGALLLVDVLVQRTRTGKAMRACALDKAAASLMGIPVDSIIRRTFMLGSALAALAGVCYSLYIGSQVSFRMGVYPGVMAFSAAVLGGIGHVRGAFLGGLVMGCVEVAARAWVCPALGISGGYSTAFAFALLIGVITTRPAGLLGRPEAQRA